MRRAGLSKVLAIAGSDSSGGAGIQADVKTLTALGVYAATAVTAITVQDSRAVHEVHLLPARLVAAQIETALADPGIDAIKIGMLGDASIVAAVAAALGTAPGVPVIIDPVLAASSGGRLLTEDALGVLRNELFPRATIVTPNVQEAALLSGIAIHDLASMEEAARALVPTRNISGSGGRTLTLPSPGPHRTSAMGTRARGRGEERGTGAVLVKGGHLSGETVIDVLASKDGVIRFEAARLPGPSRRGTGCTLASAIAAGIAQGLALEDSIRRARAYVRAAIAAGLKDCAGSGFLQHWTTLDPTRLAALGD